MANCSWCNCPEKGHNEYRECPLLDGKLLCDVCCNYDVLSCDPKTNRLEIIDVIKKVTGKDMTEHEVIKTCRECRKGINFALLTQFNNNIKEVCSDSE